MLEEDMGGKGTVGVDGDVKSAFEMAYLKMLNIVS